MKTLILGNGLSRLSFDDYIRRFPGEVWGCNYAYIDYGEILSVLTGHVEVMHMAKKYREKHGLSFRIISGHLGRDSQADMAYSCPSRFFKDSGTSLVAEALHLEREVYLCGFDLGGKDVYTPNHDKMGKESWIRRWRLILEEYGSDRVHFVGHDHLPFLLSNEPPMKYTNIYRDGKPHIDDKAYHDVYYRWNEKNYERIMEEMEMALLINRGKREWDLKEIEGTIKPQGRPGDKVTVVKAVAEKYVKLYPREFEMHETEGDKKGEEMILSESVKEVISGIKGLGIKRAVSMFTEAGADTEEKQMKKLEELIDADKE